MVVVEAARPPSGGDSPYAEAMSKKGKQSSVGSVASMKLLMRGVTSRDIFSRAPSRTASLNLRRTSGEEGSGSSAMQTMETIEHSASDASDTETVSRARGSSAVAATNAAKGAMKRTDSSVIRGLVGDAIDKVSGTETTGFAKTEEQRVKSMEAASGAMKRTDSSVIRGLVGDAIDKAAGTETTGFTKTEEQRVKSIEVMLSKREKEEEAEGESPAGEPSTAHLKAELAKLQMKRVVAEVDDCVTSIEVMLSKRGAESESPEGEPSSADLRAELTGLQVKRVAAVDAGVKSIELILNTRDAQGEAPAGGASTAALKAELAGLQVKHVATIDARLKSIEVMLSKRDAEGDAEGESPAGEPSSADLKSELAGLQVKRATAVAAVADSSVVFGAPALTKSEEERVKSIEVMLSQRDDENADEAPEGEPSTSDLKAELAGLKTKRVDSQRHSLRPSLPSSLSNTSLASSGTSSRATPARSRWGKLRNVFSTSTTVKGITRTDSSVVRGLVGDAIDKVSATETGFTKTEEQRVTSIEVMLSKRGAQGEAPAGEASLAALKSELALLQVKRVEAVDARVKSIEVMLSKRGAQGEAPAGEASTADLKAELALLQVKRVEAVDARVKSIEVMLSKRGAQGEAPAGEASTADLKAELAGLQVKRVAAVDERLKSIEVMLSKRGAQGEAPAGEASLAALKAELAGLQVKRVAVVDARVKSIEVMLSKRGAQGEAPAGEASTDALKAELALLQVKRVAVVDARVKSIEVMLSKRGAQGEAPAGEASLAALKSELALLQVKRVAAVDERLKSIEVILSERGAQGEAPAGEASTAALHAELAGLQVKLVEAADARVTSIEVMLSERGTQGESSSGEPSTAALKAELANLQVKRVAAVDARVTSIEVMLSARDAGNESAAGEPSTAALRAELAGLLVPRVAFPEAKDALAPFDLVVTSPAVRGRGKSPLAPRPPAKFAAAPSSPPRLGVRPAVVFAGPGPGGQTQPRAPSLAPSHQRSQFGAMIDSSKRSSPSVGFGGALRFDFQQVSAPDPWSKRGRAMRRSFSRLSGVSGDDSRVSGSGPGPGTYDTQQHGAFGVQHVATKRSFPALSMGKAGRFAAYERETRPTLGFPGPDKYIAHPSVGAQIVSRCDTLPAIHFPREVRPLGAVDDTCDDDDNARGPGAYKYVPGLGVQFMSGRVTAPARGFTKAKRFRLETVSGDSCGGGDGDGNDEPDESEPTHETLTARPYNSVGDQASSLKRNAPMFGFGSSYREQAALVSLTKKQAKKLLAGRLGPGPKYDPGASAHGRQVLSTKANYPRLSFPNQTRWPRGAETEAGETPGPGTYCT